MKSDYTNGMLRFRVTGEIDHHSALGVREVIDEEAQRHDPRVVVIDLGGIEFMDSSGLGLILGRYTRLRDRGIPLKIENPTKQIERILGMAGVDKLIPIVRTEKTEKKERKKKEVKLQ